MKKGVHKITPFTMIATLLIAVFPMTQLKARNREAGESARVAGGHVTGAEASRERADFR